MNGVAVECILGDIALSETVARVFPSGGIIE